MTGTVAAAARRTHHFGRLTATGLVAIFVAMAANAVVATLARALGADFVIPDGGEIPVSGIAFVTGVFSLVGVVIALALLRWSSRPDSRFVLITVSLTALSLVPPVISGAEAATIAALITLHLLAAAVMIPTLARALRTAD